MGIKKVISNRLVKLLLSFSSLFISASLSGHIDTDSLLGVLKNSGRFKKTVMIEYLMESFQRFEHLEEHQHYDVYFDSTGNLSEYCGLAIVHRAFDSSGRILKRIGYSSEGNYRLWDYWPIYIYRYFDDSTVMEHFNENNILEMRLITMKDSKGRITEERFLYTDLTFELKKIRKYSDTSNTVTIIYLDSNDRFKPNKNGVSVQVHTYDSLDPNFIIEEQYFDSLMNPIEANHDGINNICDYFKLTRVGKRDSYNTNYYNSKGESVCDDFWFWEWQE